MLGQDESRDAVASRPLMTVESRARSLEQDSVYSADRVKAAIEGEDGAGLSTRSITR